MILKDYFRRLFKYLLFLFVILGIVFLPASIKGSLRFSELVNFVFESERVKLLLIITFAYSFVYPVLVFGKKKRYFNGKFSDNKEIFFKTFEKLNYIQLEESENRLVFRKKYIFTRIMTIGEDKIDVDISSDPAIFRGMRKELNRIDKALDKNLLEK